MPANVASLPENSVLLHVGLPKSGTTALQFSAARQRAVLKEHGVLYPGKRHNHSAASFAVSQRQVGWNTRHESAAPRPLRHWHKLVKAVHAETERRVLVSHEFFAESAPEICERVVRDLGPNVHVVFTMRNQPSVLSSMWQQFLKTGLTKTFEEWLESVIGDDAIGKNRSFHRRTALADNVAKWAAIVGPENVTVIVLDPDHRELLPNTFEGLLGLPAGTLAGVPLEDHQKKSSLSFPAAELIRSINAKLMSVDDLAWNTFRNIYKHGAIDRLMRNRDAGAPARKIVPPQWAVTRMSELAHLEADRLAALDVQIVGDLTNLWTPIPGATEPPETPTTVPLSVAREMVLGAISAAERRGSMFAPVTGQHPNVPVKPPKPVSAPPKVPVTGVRNQARHVAKETRAVPLSAVALSIPIRAVRGLRRRARRITGRAARK